MNRVKRVKFTNTQYHFSVFCVQLSESLTESIVPFDATSETPLEEQRTEAMVRVQDALLARLGPEALGLLRAARSVKLSDFYYQLNWLLFFYIYRLIDSLYC